MGGPEEPKTLRQLSSEALETQKSSLRRRIEMHPDFNLSPENKSADLLILEEELRDLEAHKK